MIGIFRKIILANELGGDLSLIYRFSDAGGRSGWSFGLCQFDIKNNGMAVLCLQKAGFTSEEIAGLRNETIDIEPMNDKLLAAKNTVDKWDTAQLERCLLHTSTLCRWNGIELAQNTLYHLADYHNQYYLSVRGWMHRHIEQLDHPITPEDIYRLKLETAWGKKRPDDVKRRFDNITRLTT